jgi:hypothetical protein
MPNVEVERLPENFKAEISKIYSGAMHSGVISSGRRAYVLSETAKLRAKYGAKIVALRRSYPEKIVDACEIAIVKIESEFASSLPAMT